MIHYPQLAAYAERYSAFAAVALRVVCHLVPGSRLAGYDPLHLDNLLARLVVDDATGGRGLPASAEPYALPVPLACLWREPGTGLPLWAATQFRPVGPSTKDVSYWHKRAQSGLWTGTPRGTYVIAPQHGRWMERRVPLPTTACDRWEAEALGSPAEIARLLVQAAFIGKRRTNGFGEVLRWEVEPLEEFRLARDGTLTRPLPAGAVGLLGGARPAGEPAPVGWTPPEWKPDLFRAGWWGGTPLAASG